MRGGPASAPGFRCSSIRAMESADEVTMPGAMVNAFATQLSCV